MTRDQMIYMVNTLCNNNNKTEEEDYEMLDKLAEAIPNSQISDLMFHDSRELSPSEIVDEAITRQLDYIASSR